MIIKRTLSVLAAVLLACPAFADASTDHELAEKMALIEKDVDLSKPPSRGPQQFYYLLDENGKVVSELHYVIVGPFSEGMAYVIDHHPDYSLANGFIDTSGKLVIPISFPNSGLFSEGLAWVYMRPNGYIDRTGAFVFRNKDFYDGSKFSEGLAAVRVRMSSDEVDDGRVGGENLPGLWGYVDREGKFAVAPKYNHAEDFHLGLAGVALGKDWMFIDKKGTVVGGKYEAVGSFRDDLAPVRQAGKWGYIDREGRLSLPAKFDQAKDFSDGLAGVKVGGKYGFIDMHGSLIVPPRFADVDHFSEGLCAVNGGSGKWEYINKSGMTVIPPSFDRADPFSEGRAMVTVKPHIGFIDSAGKYIVPPRYDSGFSYVSGRAVVQSTNHNNYFMRLIKMENHLKGMKVHKDTSSPTGVYIPENLDDALNELDAMLPELAKNDIKVISREEMNNYHMGLGMWLRNQWGLWKGQRLSRYFRDLGLQHPDDMSGAVLDAYWSKLHGQSYNLAAQVATTKKYYDSMKPVVDVSVKLSSSIGKNLISMTSGEAVSLESIVTSSKVTVLAICGRADVNSPRLIEVLDELAPHYRAKHANFVAVRSSTGIGGAITTIGFMKDGKMVRAEPGDPGATLSTAGGCRQGNVPASLIQDLRKLLEIDSIVIPQTLIIGEDMTVTKRMNGFDKDTKANLTAEIERCLGNEASAKNQVPGK